MAGPLRHSHIRLVESSAAELRLAEARAFVETRGKDGDVLDVGVLIVMGENNSVFRLLQTADLGLEIGRQVRRRV